MRSIVTTILVVGLTMSCQPKNGLNQTTPTTVRASTPRPMPDVPASRVEGTSLFNVSVPKTLLEKPIGLTDEAGTFSQVVSTESAEAQKYHNQGQAYLVGYAWIEAARSFHEALRRDDSLAMSWAGLALAYDGLSHHDAASAALDRAVRLARGKNVTPKEAQWVRAIAFKFIAMRQPLSAQGAAHDTFRKELDKLVELDEADANSWVLRGTAEEPGPWGRGQNGDRAAEVYYRKALELDAKNLGGLHFQAHTLENLGRHAEALALAKQYAAQATGVPHAHHMVAHCLPRLGRWEEARETLLEADRLHRNYIETHAVTPETDWHFGHNLMILGVVELRLGNVSAAEIWFKQAYDLNHDGFYEAIYAAPYLSFLLWKGDTKAALSAAEATEKSESSFARLIAASTAGQAHMHTGNLDKAKAAAARMDGHFKTFESEMSDESFAMFTTFAAHPHQALLVGMIDGDTAALLKLGDGATQTQSIDGWAQGLFMLDRIRKTSTDQDLKDGMKRRIEIIDPDFFSIER